MTAQRGSYRITTVCKSTISEINDDRRFDFLITMIYARLLDIASPRTVPRHLPLAYTNNAAAPGPMTTAYPTSASHDVLSLLMVSILLFSTTTSSTSAMRLPA